MNGIDEWEESLDVRIREAETVLANITESMINVKPSSDEHVLTQIYITPRRKMSGFSAWFSFWSDGGVKNLSYFTKQSGVKNKLINEDSAATKIAACLRAGCSVKFSILLFKKISTPGDFGPVSEARFNLKLVGTEVILEPIA